MIARQIALPAAALCAANLVPLVLGIPGLPRFVPGAAGRGRSDHVAITFDDGPHPNGTTAVLHQLRRQGVRATFFLVGEQLQRYPDVGRRIAGEGHEIAVHGWNHRPLPLRNPVVLAREIANTCDLIHTTTSATPRWYRPPYGAATAAALTAALRVGLRPVWWTRWGRDWTTTATGTSIAGAVTGACGRRGLRGGDTVLLHDSDSYAAAGSWWGTAQAVPEILARITDIGCRSGTLTEHIGNGARHRGEQLQ